MFRTILFLLLLLPTNLFAFECSKDIDELSRRLEINIYCSLDKDKPDSVETRGSVPQENDLKIFFPVLKKFTEQYNDKFLKTNLKAIFLIEHLKYFSSEVGGLSDSEYIYINIHSRRNEETYLRTLHHEFSSNILKSDPIMLRDTWYEISKGGYMNYPPYAFEKKCRSDFTFAFDSSIDNYENGYLYNYSKTGSENDFNTYAEDLFVNPKKFQQLKNYSKIQIKLSFVKFMYRFNGYTGKFPDET